MQPENKFYVISNTHWDREWRFPFERTRAMLTELFDNLLSLFEKHDNFKVFHMDAHTIPLEDYLEIKPEKRPVLEKYVREGRLLIGPWYTLPDSCSVSGEAIVRNLIRGRKQAREFGKCMNVGYTPNGFGQPSQLPQIYAGFGIDSVLFYRGVDRANWTQEFIWQGPDGTQALAFRFGMYARYNFFFLVYRPTVHNREAFECRYDWNDGGLPFHVCRDLSYEPYYLLQFKPHFNASKIVPGMEKLLEVDAKGTTIPLVAAMMGCDSTAPDELEGNIVDEANRQLGREAITHASIEDFVADSKKLIDRSKLTLATGEMRHTLQGGGQTYLHYDIYGTRVYLRQANAVSEVLLENVAEPICAIASLLGEEYPHGLLNLAWKLLHQNHAHDSICGCAMDRVHEDVMNRFARMDDISQEVARMSLSRIVPHVDTRSLPKDSTLLMVFNPLPYSRSEVLPTTVDFQREPDTTGVEITDLAGKSVASQLLRSQLWRPTVQKPNDIPSPFFAKRHHIEFQADDIPALGYKIFIAKPTAGVAGASPADTTAAPSLVTGKNTLENEHVKVTVKANGTFDLKDKHTARTYRGLGLFQDGGDIGDPWLWITPQTDTVLTTKAARAKVAVVAQGPLMARLQIDLKFRLPKCVTPDRKARSTETADLPIRVVLTLRKDSRMVDVQVSANNNVLDHRLRMVFPTNLVADFAHAHTQFDVVRRNVSIPKVDPKEWIEPPTGLEPQKWFVDVSNGKHGLCVLDQGVTQYEVIDDDSKAIAFTLMRCYQNRNSFQDIDYPDQGATQCQGENRWHFAVYPHQGNYIGGGVMAQAFRWNVAPVVAQIGVGQTGHLPTECSFLELSPAGDLAFSGIKPAEDGSGDIVVRFWNSSEQSVSGQLRTYGKIANATEVRLDETEIRPLVVENGNTVKFDNIGTRKIVTVKLKIEKQ